MKRFFSLAILTVVAFGGLSARVWAAPPSAVMQPIDAVIAAVNADRAAAMDANFSPDAVVVDDFAPYAWRGASAASRWWSALDRAGAKVGFGHFHAVAFPIKYFDVSGDGAYVVVPLRIAYVLKGRPKVQTGLWTFTLRRAARDWKIQTVT